MQREDSPWYVTLVILAFIGLATVYEYGDDFFVAVIAICGGYILVTNPYFALKVGKVIGAGILLSIVALAVVSVVGYVALRYGLNKELGGP